MLGLVRRCYTVLLAFSFSRATKRSRFSGLACYEDIYGLLRYKVGMKAPFGVKDTN